MLSGRRFSSLILIGIISALAYSTASAQTMVNSTGTGGINQVKGKVYMPNGAPTDLSVEVELDGTFGTLKLRTSAGGSFTFENLAPGPYTVVVNAGEQFETARESVLVDDSVRTPFPSQPVPRVITVPVYLQLKRGVAQTEQTGVINAKWVDISKDAIQSVDKGNAAALNKQLDKAEADFKKAIEIAPTYAPAYLALGKLYLSQGKLDDAISNLHLAIHYDPTDFESRLTLGIAFLNQKELDGAQRELTEAASQNKTAVMPRYYLGLVFLQKRNTDAARKELEAAKEMTGDHVFPLLHRFLGVVYAAKQMNKEAVVELETYIKQDPKAKDTDQVKQAIADLKSKLSNKGERS